MAHSLDRQNQLRDLIVCSCAIDPWLIEKESRTVPETWFAGQWAQYWQTLDQVCQAGGNLGAGSDTEELLEWLVPNRFEDRQECTLVKTLARVVPDFGSYAARPCAESAQELPNPQRSA